MLSVRELRLDGDLPAIHAIVADEVATGTAHWSYEPPSMEELRRNAERLIEDGYPYLVAHRDSQLLGFAYAGPFRTRQAYRYTVENSIYVARAAHRQGVAKTLMLELIAQCEKRGYRQMLAGIGAEDPTASIALHASLGFVEVGRMPTVGVKFGRWLDLIWMQRELTAP